MKKDLDRLDRMFEDLNQQMTEVSVMQTSLKKEVDNLTQFVEMLQKTINQVKLSATQQQPVQ